MANLSASCFMRVATTMPSAGDHFLQRDFWTGIASECGIAAVDDKPGCGCVVILRTKLPELSRLAKIVADPNHRKE
jgi:hypothetical protein